MRYLPLCIALVVLSACSSDDGDASSSVPGGGACTTVTGVYQETDVYDDPAGDCPQDADAAAKPSTVTITKDAGGDTVSLESAALGGSCSLVLDGCKASGKCEVRTKTGEPVVTLQISWTFTDTGFTGFASIFTAKHPKTGKSCTSNYKTTGAKK